MDGFSADFRCLNGLPKYFKIQDKEAIELLKVIWGGLTLPGIAPSLHGGCEQKHTSLF